jgi:hypothetical protein
MEVPESQESNEVHGRLTTDGIRLVSPSIGGFLSNEWLKFHSKRLSMDYEHEDESWRDFGISIYILTLGFFFSKENIVHFYKPIS